MRDLIQFGPAWLSYVTTTILVLASIALGYAVARIRRRSGGKEQEGPTSTVVGSALGLLAFILGFVFGFVTNRYDDRRRLLLDEVIAIESAFHRADLIPEPGSSEVKALLREYVQLRIEIARSPDNPAPLIERSRKILEEIWARTRIMATIDLKNPDVVTLFVESVGDLYDRQVRRLAIATQVRLPEAFWNTLFLLTALSMFSVGYLSGMAGSANWLFFFIISASFSLVIVLVADLDRSGTDPRPGLIRISQQAMIDLQKRLEASP